MNYKTAATKFFHTTCVDRSVVTRLYALSYKSITAVLIISFILCYMLYPSIPVGITLWFSLLGLLSLFRIYLAYRIEKESQKFNVEFWYRLFVILAFTTALFFSLIGSVALFYVDEVTQMFVVATLIGLTAGAMSSLFPDMRIVIGYISIIIIPLIVSLLFLEGEIFIVFSFLVLVYYLTQIIVVANIYKQNSILDAQKEMMHKEQLELFKKEEAVDYFFEKAPIGIFSYNMDLVITDTNQAFLDLFGIQRNELIGRNLKDLPDQRPLPIVKKALYEAETYTGPYTSIKGLELWVEAQCFPLHNKNDNDIVGGLCLLENKTKEHQALKDLQHLALHDPLTRLLNRRGLREYVKEFLSEEKHQHYYSLFVYLDINKFKHINDSLGHKAGDKLLIAIANRLKVSVKKNCLVSRFGGDEFIVVAPFVATSAEAAEKKSLSCIERIQKAFDEPYNIDEMKLSIKTSLGVVIIEPKSNNIDEIIRYGDIAMYQAKKEIGNYVSYYDTELDKERKKIFTLQHDLRYATQNQEMEVYLQPIVTMSEEKIVAAESLLRWNHPSRGQLSPVEFIPLAIETGLISDITWWVLKKVCAYIQEMKKRGIWYLNYISVNINAKQLLLSHFVDEFLLLLQKYELQSSDIMIEVTERSLIDNFEDTKDVINALKSEGIKCAIDDFGIGYSSLSYLKKLSFDTLKMDMEFIKDIEHSPDDITLVKTILDIGKQFKYHIVVEGIEEERQKELLLEIDKELVYQGFFFSKPVAMDMFTEKYMLKQV